MAAMVCLVGAEGDGALLNPELLERLGIFVTTK